ncbi:MAG: type II toxin-antitoxin system HipA family toxin [Ghiorsea sp.]|nr:type II toxin-antitoxin system HipA family toxin [Ghiorsea sp.]
MSMSLQVYLMETHVGVLRLNQKRKFEFQYGEAWLEHEKAVPLSLSLPLQVQAFSDELARPFFSNLLPESEVRKAIARQLGVSEGNDFALLESIGGECAGAVSLLPNGVSWSRDGEYKKLDNDALNALVEQMPQRPMLVGEGDYRLSLAGAQNKLPVLFEQGIISMPMGFKPSSHILKPPIQNFFDTVENEIFCMRLAKTIGLEVPDVILLQKEKPLYLIVRYDRKRNSDGELIRLHQEDFCQSMGIAPDMKYENEGGPSLQACFQLVREHSVSPIADVKALLQWVIFNYTIGNADAHGKNLSFLFSEREPQLAPFYDLLCTVIYPGLSSKSAMKIGGEYRPDRVAERHWQQLAMDIGVNYKIVKQTIKKISAKITAECDVVADDFERNKSIKKVLKVINQRVKKLQMTLGL